MEWIKFSEKLPEKDISVLVFDNGLTMGFTAGANWADETMIDKACEWLDKNFMNLMLGKTRSVYAGGNFATVDEMIANFRKAMEK